MRNLLFTLTILIASTVGHDEVNTTKLLEFHNKARLSLKIEPLIESDELDIAAQRWAATMAQDDRMRHSSMNYGENIAWNYENQQSVIDGWMKSPGHKANILNKDYKFVGFGAARNNKQEIYWCVCFKDANNVIHVFWRVFRS